jgi:hypothetical protein
VGRGDSNPLIFKFKDIGFFMITFRKIKLPPLQKKKRKKITFSNLLSIIALIISLLNLGLFCYFQNQSATLTGDSIILNKENNLITEKNYEFSEAKEQLSFKYNILFQQEKICNNSNFTSIQKNRKLYTLACQSYNLGDYNQTVNILKGFNLTMPCLNETESPYAYSFLTGSAIGIVNFAKTGMGLGTFVGILIVGALIIYFIKKKNKI